MKNIEASEVMTEARYSQQAYRCITTIADAVCRDPEYFCSASCAQGSGCTHQDCECAVTHRERWRDS